MANKEKYDGYNVYLYSNDDGSPVEVCGEGFKSLKSVNRFLRLRGRKGDKYVVKYSYQQEPGAYCEEGSVGSALKNKKGEYTNYHYLNRDYHFKPEKWNYERVDSLNYYGEKKNGKKK